MISDKNCKVHNEMRVIYFSGFVSCNVKFPVNEETFWSLLHKAPFRGEGGGQLPIHSLK